MFGQMTFTFTLKRRFRKPITVTETSEGLEYAVANVHRKYPKHKIL